MGDFGAQGLANAAWAFVTAGRSNASLLAALSRAAERRTDEFHAQELANVAWAVVTASATDALFFVALSSVAEIRVG